MYVGVAVPMRCWHRLVRIDGLALAVCRGRRDQNQRKSTGRLGGRQSTHAVVPVLAQILPLRGCSLRRLCDSRRRPRQRCLGHCAEMRRCPVASASLPDLMQLSFEEAGLTSAGRCAGSLHGGSLGALD